MRLGRWSEADGLLVRHADDDETLPVGRAPACSGRKRSWPLGAATPTGPGPLLATAAAQPVDGWHQAVLDLTRRRGRTSPSATGTRPLRQRRGDAPAIPATVVLWSARFAMLGIEAGVEQALDALAAQRPIDVAEVVDHLQRRLDDVQRRGGRPDPSDRPPTPPPTSRTRWPASPASPSPDPEAWSLAAERWAELGDRWWVAVARSARPTRPRRPAPPTGAAAALREAHQIAVELGAAPLLAEVEAVSRRTRLSVDAPERVVLERLVDPAARADRPRGRGAAPSSPRAAPTGRSATELYISEKTASVHVSNILRKLGVTSRVDAAAVAQRLGVT